MASSSVSQATLPRPFDAVAAGYDASFTERRLGRWLRGMVWERLGTAFQPGQHVLELGCGTGQDAVWLARRGVRVTATDVSTAMLDITRRKVDAAGVGDLVDVTELDLAELAPATLERQYDGAFSIFGPLNCMGERGALAAGLAGLVRPGGKVVLVVMGPVCPWEIGWHLARGRFKSAFRRFRSGAEAHVGDGRTLRVWYPSAHRLEREFDPYFKTLEIAGIGLLLPPSEMGRVVDRAPRFFRRLARLDRRFATELPWRYLNDHYLMMLERQ